MKTLDEISRKVSILFLIETKFSMPKRIFKDFFFCWFSNIVVYLTWIFLNIYFFTANGFIGTAVVNAVHDILGLARNLK